MYLLLRSMIKIHEHRTRVTQPLLRMVSEPPLHYFPVDSMCFKHLEEISKLSLDTDTARFIC